MLLRSLCRIPVIAISFAVGVCAAPGGLWAWDPGTDLSVANASFWGEEADDLAGWSVSGAGDVNGDGYDDVLIGAWGNQDGGGVNAGQVYLFLGQESGWVVDTDLSAADASFWGENAGDSAGITVSGAGDVNRDGFDDILIGASRNRDGGEVCAGKVYLILGKQSGWTTDTNLSTADASFLGDAEFEYVGGSVSGAGDVNGDGYDDILIGSSSDDDGGDSAGQVYLILGKGSGWAMNTDVSTVDASFWGEAASDFAGESVSGAGDVNGDGFDDILIGATGSDDGITNVVGRGYLILGKASGWVMGTNLSAADASFVGEGAYSRAGSSVSGAGDVNGDGYDDVLIAAYEDSVGGTNAGQTYLILGKASGWSMDTALSAVDASFMGEDPYDRSGRSVSGAGDVNGDGFEDILISAAGDNDGGAGAGKTYLFLGKTSGWAMDTNLSAADASFTGEDANDYSGWSVSGAGDVDGDGFSDILIGAYGDGDGGGQAGQAYLFLSDQTGSTDGTYKHLFGSGDSPASNYADADLTIDFSTAASIDGFVTVSEHNNQAPPSAAGGVINRFWTIESSGLTGFTYDLTIEYNDGEILETGAEEAALVLTYWDGGQWIPVTCATDQPTNRLTARDLQHFSSWAVATDIDRLFFDGFESGTTSAWSNSEP